MKKLAVILAGFFLLVFSCACAQERLSVTFFDVDKADAALITFPNGSRVMIDAGTNTAGKRLASRFRREGIETIDLLIITHYDKDHVGGADKILESCRVKTVMMPDYEKDGKQYKAFLKALAKHPSTEVIRLRAGEEQILDFGEASIRITAAHREVYGRDEENDHSIAARIVYGETRFFFTGDAEGPRQQELLEEGECACDVLKVPYHGRAVYNSAEFLSACAPKIAWISDGEADPPDPALVQYLEETLGAEVFCGTDSGDLTVISDGTKISIEE